jgi:nitrogen fixation protein NifU and related proteins
VQTPYGGRILEHFRRPRNQGAMAAPSASAEGSNPLCGDRVRIDLAIDAAAGVVSEAKFTANACAICVAAASLLTDQLRGMRLDAVSGMDEEDVVRSLEAEIPAARRRCATLPLEAARRAVAALLDRGIA